MWNWVQKRIILCTKTLLLLQYWSLIIPNYFVCCCTLTQWFLKRSLYKFNLFLVFSHIFIRALLFTGHLFSDFTFSYLCVACPVVFLSFFTFFSHTHTTSVVLQSTALLLRTSVGFWERFPVWSRLWNWEEGEEILFFHFFHQVLPDFLTLLPADLLEVNKLQIFHCIQKYFKSLQGY